jgi:putative transposase
VSFETVTAGNSPVCQTEASVEDAVGDKTAGIDFSSSNYLAIDDEDGSSEPYPGNVAV